jgi:dihydropteroate synthase
MIGEKYPVRVMGIINVSPESFYKGSITTQIDRMRRCAEFMVENGAAIIDVGAMSTAPYLSTRISLDEEIRRIKNAIRVIVNAVDVPISVDTTRAEVAEEAIKKGAKIVNDVTGLKGDPRMAKVIAEYGVSTILMAHDSKDSRRHAGPITRIKASLVESLRISHAAGIDNKKIVVDPGLGFFRRKGKGIGFSPTKNLPWYVWDCTVIRELSRLHDLGRPICVSASRKSFIGKILGRKHPEERLIGSTVAAVIATFNGAHLIRTHDVGETVEAVRMAENIRRLGA